MTTPFKLIIGAFLFPIVVMALMFIMTTPLYLWEHSTRSILLWTGSHLNNMLFILSVPFLKIVMAKKNASAKYVPFLYATVISYLAYCVLVYLLGPIGAAIKSFYVASFLMTIIKTAAVFLLFVADWALFDRLTNGKALSGIK